ncbi:MAG: hypothetical protein ACQESF_02690 [Nanobdellota archaeon]
MGLEKLVGYIIDQYNKGHSFAQIKEFLIRNNYPPQIVEQAISTAQNSISSQRGSIQSFVEKHLNEGFDADSIRRYLTAYGYPYSEIEKAINSSSPATLGVNHHIDISTKTFMILLILVLVVVGSGFFFMGSGGEKKALLDYNIKTLDKSVKQGSEIRFTHSFKNIGGKKDYDVFVEYFIQNIKDYNVVHRSQETIGIDTLQTSNGIFPIEEDYPPGEYILKAIVTYEDKEARAYDSFEIISSSDDLPQASCTDGIKNQNEKGIDCGGPCAPCSDEPQASCSDGIKNQGEKGVDCGGPCSPCPSCSDGVKNQGEKGIDCGGPCAPCSDEPQASCSDGIKNQGEKGIDCGGPCAPCSDEPQASCSDGIKNQGEKGVDCGGPCSPCTTYETDLSDNQIISEVKKIESDYKKGVSMCQAIQSDVRRDDCFLALATGRLNMSNICDNIASNSKADICYVHFMKLNDFTVCDKIYESFLKRSCKSYENMEGLMNNKDESEEKDTDGNFSSTNETLTDTGQNATNKTSAQERWDEMSKETIGLEDQDELLDIVNDMADKTPTENCNEFGCFNRNFENCTKARFTHDLNMSSTYIHQILGQENEKCKVSTRVTLNRETSLIGKSMICRLNNSMGFETVFNQTLRGLGINSSCSGDLAENYR